MTSLLASALLTLAQGPYSAAAPGQPPAEAPVWIARQKAEQHSFRVSAKFECPPGTAGGLLQVSISDTVVRAEFDAGETAGRRVMSINVPEKQLQGMTPENFCPKAGDAADPVIRLESRFTAQGALICRSPTGRSTTTQSSLALDAWVLCQPPAADLLEPGPGANPLESSPSGGAPASRPERQLPGTGGGTAHPPAEFRPAG